MRRLFWIIDDEFVHLGYKEEEAVIRESFPDAEIRKSSMDSYWEDLDAWGKEAIAIIAQIYVKIPREFIWKLEGTKVISVYGGGYDRVDVEAARDAGIVVTYVPDYCVEEVSDHALAFILMHARSMLSWREALEKGLWGAPAVSEVPMRLKGKTLLIVGFGRMGRALARKAKCLGMRILAFDPYLDEETIRSAGAEKVSLEEGLAIADFVSIHVPLTPGTRNLIDYNALSRAKRGVAIINTSRGEVIDERSLIRALDEGIVSRAYLDVVRDEPPGVDREILRHPRVFVTPHIAYYSSESIMELKRRAAENAVAVLLGKEPRYEAR